MSSRVLVLSMLAVMMLAACRRSPDATPLSNAVAPPPPSAPVATTAQAPEAEVATAIPETAAETWQAIDQKNAELQATVAKGSLKDVHHLAFAIRDLVAALPAKMPGLDAAAKAKLQGEAGFVETLAERLDKSGDADDRAATQASYEQLQAVLDGMSRTPPKP